MFPKRLYEVKVLENLINEHVILDINSTDEVSNHPVNYQIVGPDYRGITLALHRFTKY